MHSFALHSMEVYAPTVSMFLQTRAGVSSRLLPTARDVDGCSGRFCVRESTNGARFYIACLPYGEGRFPGGVSTSVESTFIC